jgi:hypothetical protein
VQKDDNQGSEEVLNSDDKFTVETVEVVAMPRYTRRLLDKVLIAFHQACDQSDLEVAGRLLPIIEFMLTPQRLGSGDNRRRSLEGLVAAHERFWTLRHPGEQDG